jgi:hypothetical protein
MGKTQKSQAEVINALKEAGGIISDATRILGLASVDGLRLRIRKSPKLQDALTEIRENTKDLAESVIFDALKARDKDVAKWYLASMARERGFGNKAEFEVKGKIAIQPEVDLSSLSMEELKQLEEIARKVSSNSSTG